MTGTVSSKWVKDVMSESISRDLFDPKSNKTMASGVKTIVENMRRGLMKGALTDSLTDSPIH